MVLKSHTNSFSFTMCNPPFYGSTEEVERSAEGKAMEPNAVRSNTCFTSSFDADVDLWNRIQVCTGAEVELITPGGESAFVRRMVEESLQLRDRCM